MLINDCRVAASFISKRYLLADSPITFLRYRKVLTTFILVNTLTSVLLTSPETVTGVDTPDLSPKRNDPSGKVLTGLIPAAYIVSYSVSEITFPILTTSRILPLSIPAGDLNDLPSTIVLAKHPAASGERKDSNKRSKSVSTCTFCDVLS